MTRRNPVARARLGLGVLLAILAGGCTLPGSTPAVNFWIAGGDEELGPATAARPENEIYSAARQQLRLRAALNEAVAVQLVLSTPTPPAGPFDLVVSDFAGPAGPVPAGSIATLYRVHYARVEQFRSWYPVHTGAPAVPTLFPDLLVPWNAPRGGGPLALADRRNEFVWVDFQLPATAPSGEYTGRIELRRAGRPEAVAACEVVLEILPIALPGRRSLPVICRVDPRPLLTTHLQWPPVPSAEDTRVLPSVASHAPAVALLQSTMALFHAHRTNPVLWAAFPRYTPVGDRDVEIQWDEYDALVGPWLDGLAFADRAPLAAWPLPVSLEYPDARRNGGLNSPRYARQLATYTAACVRHFEQRGWRARAFVRPAPPRPLSAAMVADLRYLGGILRQVEGGGVALVGHVPAQSLRGFGWQDAPTIELPDVTIWAPPGMWYEPAAMDQQRSLGKQTWLMPDAPPYSGSLAVETPATDPRALAWIAYRYGVQALWLEHAAEFGPFAPPASFETPWTSTALIYPGAEFGLTDTPLPSVRLKRLRRGLQDYELLRLLEDNGKQLLARSLAEQVVRWAGTEACRENLLSTTERGWPRDPQVIELARTLMLQELAGEFAPESAARAQLLDSLSRWGLMMSQRTRVALSVTGVRLTAAAEQLVAQARGFILNASNKPIQGRWTLAMPANWRQVRAVTSHAEPGARRLADLALELGPLPQNVDGIYPFELAFESEAAGVFPIGARLAVASCPPLARPPVIDGALADWPLASNNAAGDFRLGHTRMETGRGADDRPTLGTRAFFGLDTENLYVAVRCEVPPGEGAAVRPDNLVPIDGATPWGQDVVEVLIEPRGLLDGAPSDIYALQIKPTGLLVARQGYRTEPPMGPSQPWAAGARAAVSTQRDAWLVELAVPLDAFPPEARRHRVWGVNVTRLDARRGEYSSWSGARHPASSPAALGNLLMLWP